MKKMQYITLHMRTTYFMRQKKILTILQLTKINPRLISRRISQDTMHSKYIFNTSSSFILILAQNTELNRIIPH